MKNQSSHVLHGQQHASSMDQRRVRYSVRVLSFLQRQHHHSSNCPILFYILFILSAALSIRTEQFSSLRVAHRKKSSFKLWNHNCSVLMATPTMILRTPGLYKTVQLVIYFLRIFPQLINLIIRKID